MDFDGNLILCSRQKVIKNCDGDSENKIPHCGEKIYTFRELQKID